MNGMGSVYAILAIGTVDYIACTVLQVTKNQNKIIPLRIMSYMACAVIALHEFMELFGKVKAVFGL